MRRFVAFGLELFNTAFKRSRFDFHDPDVIARLEPMVKAIGNTLYSSNSEVVVLGLRASAAIIRCPLKAVEKSMSVFVQQTIDIIKQAGSTESDVAQTALKSLANMIRDCPSTVVKEKDLIYLLELLSPDLEDLARQSSVFTMLRAIVSRKFVVPEIYDIMDNVSEIMVTSQSTHVQELCRGVLLQFLLDYPQGKGRLRNYMTFLAKNLSYTHESGRISVMELLSAALAKFDATLIQEYAEMLFVGLVMVIANDDSPKCREMAAQLIKNLLDRLDIDRRRLIMSHQHAWAAQRANTRLCSVSAQVCGLVLDCFHQESAPFLVSFLEDLAALMRLSFERMQEDDEDDWQTPYHSLVVFGKIFRDFPDRTDIVNAVPWEAVVDHLLFPHTWVRLAACRLIGTLFSARAEILAGVTWADFSPTSEEGLKKIAEKLCEDLKSEHLDSAMSLQAVKNLFFVGKRFCERSLPPTTASEVPAEEGNDLENDGSDDSDVDTPEQNGHPLPWLFSKLSYQCRSAHIARRNKTSAPVRNI
jgi:U3 small nucleolar RNA-associated protein 20